MSKSTFGVCACYYTRNYFIHRWKTHIQLDDFPGGQKHFEKIYGGHNEDVEEAWREIELELERRYARLTTSSGTSGAITLQGIDFLVPFLL